MSEDEQSYSNYDTRGNHRRGHLLLCAMAALKPGERWSTDTRDFATTVDRMATRGNPIAKELLVLTGMAGRHCPDFVEMLAMARTAGLITKCYGPLYGWMDITASPRMLADMTIEFANEELGFAAALAAKFWDVTHGVQDDQAKGSR